MQSIWPKPLQERLIQKLKQFHQLSCIWICSLLHLSLRNTVSTTNTKTQMSLMFIFYPLSAIIPPFHLRPPTQPDDVDFSEQTLCNIHSTDSIWHLHLLLFKYLSNAAFWQQANYFPFHRERIMKGKQKKDPTSPPSLLNKTKIIFL